MERLKNNIKSDLKEDVPLKNLSWFKVGGKAEYFYSPTDVSDLQSFCYYKPKSLKVHVLGAGSNTLIRDKGVTGCVLYLNRLNNINLLDQNKFYVEVGCLNSSIVSFAKKHKISGIEFLTGIPGSMGGALAMNAGCFNKETKDIVVKATLLDININKIFDLQNEEIKFKYRGNGLNSDIIFLSAVLKGHTSTEDEIFKNMQYIKSEKEKAQPKRVLTGGSTFANPTDDIKAWQLIDHVGLRGYKIGGAYFSDKHCNFLINDGTATSDDIENLINYAKELILQKFNIELKEEIKILGNK